MITVNDYVGMINLKAEAGDLGLVSQTDREIIYF